METCIFRDSKYAKFNGYLFIYDGTWGSFRPITKVGWNGKQFVADDSEFKKDIFSPYYGFGSPEMKQLCLKITEETQSEININDPVVFWRWYGDSSVKWFKDRPAVFVKTCSNLDWKTYLEYLGTKNRTLRHAPRGRMTRRLLRK
jgi:hypothetical protein